MMPKNKVFLQFNKKASVSIMEQHGITAFKVFSVCLSMDADA